MSVPMTSFQGRPSSRCPGPPELAPTPQLSSHIFTNAVITEHHTEHVRVVSLSWVFHKVYTGRVMRACDGATVAHGLVQNSVENPRRFKS
mmetsp:Transcript_41191/g.66320  ORF Transcript_41191/g.66320 Transcript_41191/m.66320 type:complete len:90 (+) Transcript_41191:90-359(+)